MRDAQLRALVDQINAKSPPQRLRLAAGLLEQGLATTAQPIIRRIADELEMALLLASKAEGR